VCRYLYVNNRAWPLKYTISDPLEPPPIAEQVEVHVIDLVTLTDLGIYYTAARAKTPNDECFFIFLNVSQLYVARFVFYIFVLDKSETVGGIGVVTVIVVCTAEQKTIRRMCGTDTTGVAYTPVPIATLLTALPYVRLTNRQWLQPVTTARSKCGVHDTVSNNCFPPKCLPLLPKVWNCHPRVIRGHHWLKLNVTMTVMHNII
jgi:hypothetical protein